MGSDFGILQRRTFCNENLWELVPGVLLEWGRLLGEALLVPGYGQCHPFALSDQSSTCGQFFDIYPVIYVMSLGQGLTLKG